MQSLTCLRDFFPKVRKILPKIDAIRGAMELHYEPSPERSATQLEALDTGAFELRLLRHGCSTHRERPSSARPDSAQVRLLRSKATLIFHVHATGLGWAFGLTSISGDSANDYKRTCNPLSVCHNWASVTGVCGVRLASPAWWRQGLHIITCIAQGVGTGFSMLGVHTAVPPVGFRVGRTRSALLRPLDSEGRCRGDAGSERLAQGSGALGSG
jgi:hypothetical protein